MKELSSAEIRQMFLDFFASKDHLVVPAKSLIPENDPSLLWINSGVATLKKYFDGSVVPPKPRLTNAQKAIRTNDIENVGKTARHHTLFEMMGNFSIGDYFKEEVIPWAWELLTSPEWYGLDKEKLYVTVYPKDQESRKIWEEKTDLPAGHVYEVEDNFWDIGEGPSGPDSEIFYDRGEAFADLPADDPEMYPGGENERYLEIWNIVFSQFNHLPGLTDNSTYPELPHKNIDTGMGLERLVSVFQNGRTNFDTDLFLPIIHETEKLADGAKYDETKDTAENVSFKVVADHIRAISFAIADGAKPSNEGRGYVIRRLLRRAVLHGQKLGIQGEFLTKLVPAVIGTLDSYYPELKANQAEIEKTILAEEKRFNKTLKAGLSLLDEVIAEAKKNGQKEISGADAFKLSDTYGFPVELTEEQAEDAGLSVDLAGYQKALQEQRDRARAARSTDHAMGVQNAALTDLKVPSTYVGWTDKAVLGAKVVAVLVHDENGVAQVATEAHAGQTAWLVFDKTPFYAEMGGQVADFGTVKDENDNILAQVTDVQNGPNGQHIHTAQIMADVKVDQVVDLAIDLDRNRAVSLNHTATHMLDQALRNVIGGDVHQAGSLVEPEYLRFDFNHEGPVDQATLNQIQDQVNEQIAKNLPVTWEEMSLEDAKKVGAVAVFDDKYGDTVRVVSIGDYNQEFDGGTHAQSTAELGLFTIVSESGIGAGVRRIEALTSISALTRFEAEEQTLAAIAKSLKVPNLLAVKDKVEEVQADLKAANQQIEAMQAQLAALQAGELFNSPKQIGQVTAVIAQVKVDNAGGLRQMADVWRDKGASNILVLAAAIGDKVNLLVGADKTANAAGIKAGDVVKAIAPIVGGGGGGRPDLAQAGGKDQSKIAEALDQAEKIIGQA
ncbi:alanine--tRNA ligase [Fructobacillus evanidus]|uniref:Alanine--tRNA ligase n=1 Tax=Fructobacillus evanidus TaxID=3064281 RepID=A0ABM9MQS1_9LACO|nr:Alanyl-tRNA synthetase (AlaS) [Fructobacillus sp. LMG 32999]CAK1231387.1 Alanyl-tRNA synthetase (AlaS) [Fructobacillus sp. LMG 32999]CAK1233251.1 Alanyl-tRNA synthetase (AlaS) [Fructobacillus sp. LMG 32999]CAK1237254.1 Alanyl-tRNA synthetase (AlaS) [Fructobacillus sp. LMG 32999]CAK1237299.1 Alanyl-tRNA synthetase (AlaS) [Fructobacillus sp. LMG 32999]